MKLPDLGKQIGPLPLGAWIIVVAGGVGIALYTRNQGNETPEVVEDNSGVPGVGVGPGWTAVPPPSTAPDEDGDEITTNEQWHVEAVKRVTAGGILPIDADRAISKYLSAQPLSATERVIVNLALQLTGLPPIPPGNPITPDPTPTPGGTPKPPTVPLLWVDPLAIRRTSVVLRWAGIPGYYKYRVYRLPKSLAGNVTTSSGGIAGSIELRNLQPNTQYTGYYVVAVNAAGIEGNPSKTVNFRTKK
jgi:hypothetical protein